LKTRILVTQRRPAQLEVLPAQAEYVIQLAERLEFAKRQIPVETQFWRQAKGVMMEIRPAAMIVHRAV
jgi:hypothetical protein